MYQSNNLRVKATVCLSHLKKPHDAARENEHETNAVPCLPNQSTSERLKIAMNHQLQHHNPAQHPLVLILSITKSPTLREQQARM
jgi:hypothetical protein